MFWGQAIGQRRYVGDDGELVVVVFCGQGPSDAIVMFVFALQLCTFKKHGLLDWKRELLND